ncbi:MAG: DUF3084 domain-containing protein [Schwartzia sp.]|nr:DUF3084 domain-containing protein [Schwartzia sp. (in: firmicutes)]
MYGIVLIAALIVTGGAIAVIGDRVGSKVGKKKLSLFGLRPRHTSVIVTIITGVAITTLTFAVLAAASENVRVALFGMEKLNEEMRGTQARLDEAGQKLADAEKQQLAAGEALKKSQGEVDALKKEQAELEVRTQELTEGNAQLENAKRELTEVNETLAMQNGTLATENKELEKRTEALREGLIIMREGDIVFRAGEVLSSGVVRGGRPAEEIRGDLGALLQLANAGVAERLEGNKEENYVWIYTPEFEEAAQVIAETGEDAVVRIVAAGNLVRGEPVRATLEMFKNRTVYREGEFILARSFRLTTGQPGEAENLVMGLLQEVNAVAKEKGILPDPIRGSVGVMASSQFYETVNAMAALQGPGKISVYAREQTDSVGPLRLRLVVEPEGAAE